MRNIIFGVVFLSPPFLKKLILKWYCGAQFGRGAKIGWFSSIIGAGVMIGDYSSIKPLTVIRCDGQVEIGNYTEVSSFSIVYGCANFTVGDRCYLGPKAWINVTEDVEMGNDVGIGPRTTIFTHGSFFPYTEGYPVRFGEVAIGDNVWIASGVFLHPGIEIGDNVFINSRSVITKDIDSGHVVEGFPAKEIMKLEKIRRPVTPAKRDALIINILNHFIMYLEQVNPNLQVTSINGHVAEFSLRGKNYLVELVASQGSAPIKFQKDNYDRKIILLNCEDWAPPIGGSKTTVFDFTSKKATYSRDKLSREIYQFLKQYYGIIFEYL
jgi:acetyltransferase-like isoleucine patch superfamily enzyme